MSAPRNLNVRPELGRLGAAALGAGLGLAGLVCCLFAALPIVTWLGYSQREVGLLLVGILVLFGAMAAVLLPASWSLGRYAVTGRRGPLLSRGPVVILSVVLTAVFLATVIVAAWRGYIADALVVLTEGASLVALVARYLRSSRAS